MITLANPTRTVTMWYCGYVLRSGVFTPLSGASRYRPAYAGITPHGGIEPSITDYSSDPQYAASGISGNQSLIFEVSLGRPSLFLTTCGVTTSP
jgi:hypothetical protein